MKDLVKQVKQVKQVKDEDIKLKVDDKASALKKEASLADLQEPLVHSDLSKLHVGKKAEVGDVGENGTVVS